MRARARGQGQGQERKGLGQSRSALKVRRCRVVAWSLARAAPPFFPSLAPPLPPSPSPRSLSLPLSLSLSLSLSRSLHTADAACVRSFAFLDAGTARAHRCGAGSADSPGTVARMRRPPSALPLPLSPRPPFPSIPLPSTGRRWTLDRALARARKDPRACRPTVFLAPPAPACSFRPFSLFGVFSTLSRHRRRGGCCRSTSMSALGCSSSTT